MNRLQSITCRLSFDEKEWLKRHAHWEQVTPSEIMRRLLHAHIAQTGYLRPADDEPQDFGYEKEMMQFVNGLEE